MGCGWGDPFQHRPFRAKRPPIIERMPVTLAGQLVVAISSRALFDFEEENKLFESSDDRAYMRLQLGRLDAPAQPGVAFSLVQKLLAFNELPSAAGTADHPCGSLHGGVIRVRSGHRCRSSPHPDEY